MTDQAISPLNTISIFLLHRAQQNAHLLLAAKIGGIAELTAPQLAVLVAISEVDDANQTQLTARTGMDRSTMADVVRRLVSRSLVQRQRSRTDQRAYRVRLTPEGRSLLQKTLPLLEDVNDQLLSEISPPDRSRFLNGLVAMAKVGKPIED